MVGHLTEVVRQRRDVAFREAHIGDSSHRKTDFSWYQTLLQQDISFSKRTSERSRDSARQMSLPLRGMTRYEVTQLAGTRKSNSYKVFPLNQ